MKTTTIKREHRPNILKNFLLVGLSLALVLVTMGGCEGPEGPEGPQGTQGAEGPAGPVGPAGEDGSVIHAGTGAPSADTGVNDDYYLDQNTGELYGPKNDDGWGTPISLQGSPGEDGSQIYSGIGSPDASLGIIGDYYLDNDNFDLYGPKTDSDWGTPINLKGTANVVYSSWANFDTAVRDTTIDGSDLKVVDINAPQLSQEILDEGVMNVYMAYSDDVYPLPYTGYAGGSTNTVDFLPRLNRIFITRFSHDNSANVGFNSSLEFRYVLIPGGVAANNARMSKDQIKEMSYREVQKRFGIRD